MKDIVHWKLFSKTRPWTQSNTKYVPQQRISPAHRIKTPYAAIDPVSKGPSSSFSSSLIIIGKLALSLPGALKGVEIRRASSIIAGLLDRVLRWTYPSTTTSTRVSFSVGACLVSRVWCWCCWINRVNLASAETDGGVPCGDDLVARFVRLYESLIKSSSSLVNCYTISAIQAILSLPCHQRSIP